MHVNCKNLIAKLLAVIILALVVLTLFGSVKNVAYAEENTSTFELTEGGGGQGTLNNPYWEEKWNGSIKNTESTGSCGGGKTYVDITVDPRNNIAFNDDVRIKFSSYYISSSLGRKISYPLGSIKVYVKFYNQYGSLLETGSSETFKGLENKTFYVKSSQKKVEGVSVRVIVNDKTYYYKTGSVYNNPNIDF